MLSDALIGCLSAVVIMLAGLAAASIVRGSFADVLAVIPPVCLTVRRLRAMVAAA